MNDMENLRTFADQLWKYMVPKLDSKFASNVSYFRAQVVSNPGNNTLEVQRPVENGTLTLPCTTAMSGAEEGQQVTVLVMGSMSNAIIVGDGKLNVPGGGGDAGIANFQAQPDGSLVITLTNGNTFTATPHDPTKQDVLTFDDTPTANSNNPVKSGGIYTALAGKQDTLTFDDVPTAGSSNPVKSSGIKTALDNKVDKVAGKGLSTNDYTTADKNKLAGIEAGAQVNQNAFANVKVGSTTVAADAKQDTLELVAGSNVSITADATNDKVTIAATDTTYSSKAAASGGTAVSLVTTGEKYNWNNKQNALTFDSTPTAGSNNPVKSGGIKTALDGKAAASHTHTSDAVTDLVTATKYGPTGLVSFNGREGLPLKSWLVNIEPAQAGSGTPSPTNVRAISGWAGANVTRAGKNFADCSKAESGTNAGITYSVIKNEEGSVEKIVANGTITGRTAFYIIRTATGFPAGNYIFTAGSNVTSNGIMLVVQRNRNGASVYRDVKNGNDYPLDIQPTDEIRLYLRGETSGTVVNNVEIYPMMRLASETDRTFEPYQGETIDYTFPSEAGTVYGGTLDVLKGTLTVDRASVTITGGLRYYQEHTNHYRFNFNALDGIAEPNSTSKLLSDIGVPISAQGFPSSSVGVYIGNGNTMGSLYLNKSLVSPNNESANAWVASHPVQIVYPLETPITYQLTPELVAALAGQNNFWCDAGDTTVEYGAFLAAAEGAAEAGRTYTDLHYVTAGQKSGTTLGSKATAEGYDTTASQDYSHAEGQRTTASGSLGSHAEGYGSVASGNASHAEGQGTAIGASSHAEGSGTANGDYSHAEGGGAVTETHAIYSHAEGYDTIASCPYQHVVGVKNVKDTHDPLSLNDTSLIEIVGGGIPSSTGARKNIRTLQYNGNEWIAGTLTQASDARLKDVQGEIPDLSSVRAVRFRWKNGDDKEHLGYLAQDVEEIAPYLVGVDSNGYKSLDYIALLTAKVEMLEMEIEKLKGR